MSKKEIGHVGKVKTGHVGKALLAEKATKKMHFKNR
jgi:hypothetical protein